MTMTMLQTGTALLFHLFVFVTLSTISSMTTIPTTAAPQIWRHGWQNMTEMLYMHGGNKSIISSNATIFSATHYPIVGFDNCYGAGDGTLSQEDAALATARQLRLINPNVKNTFYWKFKLDSQVSECSSAKNIWGQHPEWWISNYGNASSSKGGESHHYYDFSNPAVRTFWKNHLLSLAYEMDGGATPSRPLFDGFFIDGFGPVANNCESINIDPSLKSSYCEGARAMVAELQTELDFLGFDQLVVINGMDSVATVAVNAEVSPASMVDHFAIIQFLNHKTGEWLYEPMRKLLFDVVRSPLNENRTVIVKAWPGPIVQQKDIWPGGTQPSSDEEMRQAALDYLNTALALFLLVAEDNVWFSYSWFWGVGDYIPFGINHTCPDEFYPLFECPVGVPLGPPKEASSEDYVYTREYEYVSVYVDLKDRNATRVTWKRGDPYQCPGALHSATEKSF